MLFVQLWIEKYNIYKKINLDLLLQSNFSIEKITSFVQGQKYPELFDLL